MLDQSQGKIANDNHFDTTVFEDVMQHCIVEIRSTIIHIRISRKATNPRKKGEYLVRSQPIRSMGYIDSQVPKKSLPLINFPNNSNT